MNLRWRCHKLPSGKHAVVFGGNGIFYLALLPLRVGSVIVWPLIDVGEFDVSFGLLVVLF